MHTGMFVHAGAWLCLCVYLYLLVVLDWHVVEKTCAGVSGERVLVSVCGVCRVVCTEGVCRGVFVHKLGLVAVCVI